MGGSSCRMRGLSREGAEFEPGYILTINGLDPIENFCA